MAATKGKRPAEVLTETEMRSLLAACSRRAPTGIRDRALLTVLYRAGLGMGQELGLPVPPYQRPGPLLVRPARPRRRPPAAARSRRTRRGAGVRPR